MSAIDEKQFTIYSRPKHDTEDDNIKAKIEADNKDKQMIDEALERMRRRNITNTEYYTWELMQKQQKYYQKQKQNQNQKKKKKEKISKLVNDKFNEMCRMGHGNFGGNKSDIKDYKCIICGSMEGRKYCDDCYWYGRGTLGGKMEECLAVNIYCKKCRLSNAKNIKKQIKLDRFKSEIIRNELLDAPELELDILCALPRRAALDVIIKDINKLKNVFRANWALFVFDMDHLKIWNTSLGHVKTDQMIQQIGNVLKKYETEINNGQWNEKEKGKLDKSFAFRTGGDEFCFAVRSDDWIYAVPLGPLYFSIKQSINKIGSNKNISNLFNATEEKEYKNTMEALANAKDRNEQPIKMDKVGISAGLYVPYHTPKNNRKEEWLYCGDKYALEHAKELNPPQKNQIAIYYEGNGGLINDIKTLKALEDCVGNVF